MFRNLFRYRRVEIDPHEVLIDASNLPAYDEDQFEGRMERPISKRTLRAVGLVSMLVILVFLGRMWLLQIEHGEAYAAESEENRLRQSIVFADRGVIYDRRGVELAWNNPNESDDFARRTYIKDPGFAHLTGYIGYPTRDAAGFFYRTEYVGKDGIERAYQDRLEGENGIKLVETNASGEITSESVARKPIPGDDLALSIDAGIQTKLYEIIQTTAHDVGFRGGAAAIMDVETGELLALTSYPEYDATVLSNGEPREEIDAYVLDEGKPFLDRPTAGLYAPGSIIKPFIAVAALEEETISPHKLINSTGALVIPNPYFPDKPSIFRDWKAHGLVDMRQAIAVSSDQYFYIVGGGVPAHDGVAEEKGLGIERISHYLRLFGFAEKTGVTFTSESRGTIPTPEWKKEVFDEEWLLGNTYHTAIGQYGFQTTVLQALRAFASIANNGTLVTPVIVAGERGGREKVPVSTDSLQIVREGMRLAVEDGTARGLNVPYVEIAAKTGTAELGTTKNFVNSWVTGFFPYESPRYAFIIMMEHGPTTNLIGGVSIMRKLIDWMRDHASEYFEIQAHAKNKMKLQTASFV